MRPWVDGWLGCSRVTLQVRTVITFHGRQGVRFILDTTPLSDVFKMFKQSVYHMMIAVSLK